MFGSVQNTFNQGFAGQTYGQWFLFTLLFVAFWWMSISANAMLRSRL